ncbi:MAG: tyrosine-type recombinase/integrase [Acidimicrobiia bacterium]
MNGSIQHRPERGSNPWRARYRGPDGREHSKTFARKVEAEQWLRGQLSAADRGDWLDPSAGHLPFGKWVERWQAQRLHLAPATAARDTSLLGTHVIPRFADRRLAGITQEEVAAWVAELSTRLSPTTTRKVYELFSASMEAAVTAGRIGRSPCRGVKLPRLGDREEMRILTPAEVAELADTINPRYRAMVLVGAYAGLRWGETAALRDRRMDLLRGTLRVEETLTDVRGRVAFKEPKSKASRRQVTLPASLAEELRGHLENFGVSASGLLFRSPQGEVLRRTGWTRRFWHPAVRKSIGGTLRFHDLRHVHASYLIAEGAHAKLIQERLGHTSIRTTLDLYGHLFSGLDQAAADSLDRLMRSADAAPVRPSTVLSIGEGVRGAAATQ